MDRSRREDPRLSEVKAVLQRLQRIATDPETDPSDLQAATEKAPRRSRRMALAASLGLAGAVLIIAGAFALLNRPTISTVGRLDRPPAAATGNAVLEGKPAVVPGSAPIPGSEAPLRPPVKQPVTPPRPALEAALGLLSTGRVQAARRQLLALVSEDAADVAWALARSYDPNVLATIPAADAQPDIAEATRWYRAWHAAAINQGLVAHSVSLERIIGSMR